MSSPNYIDGTGIHIEDFAQILSDIIDGTADVPGLAQIYGADINVGSNSPDGQSVNIFALSKQDILNLCVQIYDSYDIDQAVGDALDRIAALSGTTRKGGTYTQVPVAITTSQSVSLPGLLSDNTYTVSDLNGNQYQLIADATISSGTHSLLFQSVNVGAVQVAANTITTPVSIVAGIVSITNPSGPTQTGINEETDAQLRMRQQYSQMMPAQGVLQALTAALNNLSGVSSAFVFENATQNTSPDGVPPFSIWAIVEGGVAVDIATAIYNYRSAGCGMFGSQSYAITQSDGSEFIVSFDFAASEDLFVKLHVDSINSAAIDYTGIANYLATNYVFTLNQPANVGQISILVSQFNPNLVVSQSGVSTDGSNYGSVVYPTSKKNFFTLPSGNVSFI